MSAQFQYENDLKGTSSLMKETLRKVEDKLSQLIKSINSSGATPSAVKQVNDVVCYVADITETLAALFTASPVAAKAMASVSVDLSSLYQHGVIPAGRIYLGERVGL